MRIKGEREVTRCRIRNRTGAWLSVVLCPDAPFCHLHPRTLFTRPVTELGMLSGSRLCLSRGWGDGFWCDLCLFSALTLVFTKLVCAWCFGGLGRKRPKVSKPAWRGCYAERWFVVFLLCFSSDSRGALTGCND